MPSQSEDAARCVTRRQVLAAMAGLGVARRGAAQPVQRPNIVFVLADDLGWGDLGCYGNRVVRTPHLDQLARQGTLYTQFYSNSPVCSPSRTAWMTGHFPAEHHIHGHLATPEMNARRAMPNFLDPAIPNAARLLKEQGYVTGHVGKWHLGSGPGARLPDAYGFDWFRTHVSNDTAWAEEKKNPYFWARSSGLLVDESIRFLEQSKGGPFYLNLWTMLPHATLHPTEEQMQPYRRYGPQTGTTHRGATEIYYGSVSELDKQLGRLFAKLEELGLAGNTMVLFSSDNGPEDITISNASHSGVGSAGPLRGRKRSLYEGGVRVPLIVRWPGQTPADAVDNDSVLTAVDFLPTVAAMNGAGAPPDMDGEDVRAALTGRKFARSRPILWEWRYRIAGHEWNRSPMLAIRDGQWKLMMNPDRSRVELYDIPADPGEMTNLAAAHKDVVEHLARPLLAWHRKNPEAPLDPEAGKAGWPWPGATK
jgi:N-acetylgalactosamine-6-sulfatase